MNNRMTIVDLLRYFHEQMLERLAKHDEEELNYLSTTLREIWEAAEHYGDKKLYSLLDDMDYVVNETLMGAQSKGEYYLPDVAAKLKELEEAEQS